MGAVFDLTRSTAPPSAGLEGVLRLDTLTALAAQSLGMPFAMVLSCDAGRHSFRSVHGLEAGDRARDLPMVEALSAMALLAGEPVFVAADTGADPRLAGLELGPRGSGIGFYAGALLLDSAGAAAGLLCVMDRQPRVFGEEQQTRLAAFAKVAVALSPVDGVTTSRQLTATDPLTGFANAAMFRLAAQEGIAATRPKRISALLCIELDRFSHISDTFAEAESTLFLQAAAIRIRGNLRAGDIVGRIGGDAFVVLLRDLERQKDAEVVAERMVEILGQAFEIGGRMIRIQAAVGVAVCPMDGTEVTDLLGCADAALDRVRRGLGSRVGRYHPAIDRRLGEEIEFEADLAQAAAADRLLLHWQPVVRCWDGRLVGFEALTRWNRLGHGRIAPARFLPVAERTGLYREIDRWALLAACRVALGWTKPLRVAVNLSSCWFQHEAPSEMVADCLTRTGLDPRRLQIEVTERVFVEHGAHARDELLRLRELGVRLALDDFGSGTFPLSGLKDLPFHQIKLDPVFVDSLGTSRRASSIVRAVLQLSDGLGMSVCAEGVMRESQLTELQAEGCTELQGFLIGRPGPLTPAYMNACRMLGASTLFRPRVPSLRSQ